ncbi:MAG TPA: SpoIIE family protein phosphatase [Terriglobales bacterium]|jgi:serine phosphatase RsbU (regulator of sigma subunit)/pSer/pThr/pTyr-binding forkhead associated (FHA) protein
MSFEQNRPARIIFREGAATRTIELAHTPFSIGRSTESDLCINHPQVSRTHVLIDLDNDGYFVRDVGSRHGTLLNDTRTEFARLKSGDALQLGASAVTLHFVTDEMESTNFSFLEQVSLSTSKSDIEKLSLFLQAVKSLSSSRMLTDVLSSMLEYTLRITHAERGFVFLGDTPSALKLECGRNHDGTVLASVTGISQSIMRDAAQSGLDFILGDATRDGMALGRESILTHELRSVIAIPLRSQSHDRIFGLLYLDSRLQTCDLSSISKEILGAIAREAATLVENAYMVQAEQAAGVLRKELEIAAGIQGSIIPREIPVVPCAKILAKIAQCTEVGGDFYDLIPVTDGIVAVVADVSGKGMSAAILASVIQGMIYAQITTGASLVECVTAVNSFLCSRVSGRKYVTLAALRITAGKGTIEIVNGGHTTPIVLMPDGTIKMIEDGDVPVGLFKDAKFHAIEVAAPAGTRIALMSDGLSEAEDNEGKEFGCDGITSYLASPNPIDAIFAAVDEFCQGHPQHDDRTLLVIECC